ETGDWKITKSGAVRLGVQLASLDEDQTKQPTLIEPDEDDESEDSETEAPTDGIAVPVGHLQPVAYLWTRTVRCKNPRCAAIVPLVKQTWLCKKAKRYAALKMTAPRGKRFAQFVVVESRTEKELGFDPAAFSKGGNATCPFCGTVADVDYVKDE